MHTKNVLTYYVYMSTPRPQFHDSCSNHVLVPYMHRRIAYQGCSNSFAVAACRTEVATQDDPRTFKPLRQRYVILQGAGLTLLVHTPFI